MSNDSEDAVRNSAGTGEYFGDVLDRALSRRGFLHGLGVAAGGVAASALLAGCGGSSNSPDTTRPPPPPPPPVPPKLGYTSVPISTSDTLVVPPGYTARLLNSWGDPVSNGPAFRQDGSNTTEDQMQQVGMHHDGMHFFSLPWDSGSSVRGLLVFNNEYVEAAIIHPDGGYAFSPATYSLAKARKEMAAHGVSILEVAVAANGQWQVVRPSQYGRRITAMTPMTISGPAAGSAHMRTSADATGRSVLGTFNNCGHGWTPWGTFLTCEENFAGYFDVPAGHTPPNVARYSRYGIAGSGAQGYAWATVESRFNVASEPNESHRHGWVVEIDPFDPTSTPVKRTSMGRFAHEGAWTVLGTNNRMAVYSGDDARFEYVYKFVPSQAYVPGNAAANRNLLDDGILYAAKFNDDGSGEWVALVHGQNGLTAANGFADQAEVLIFARQAADRVGATKMDRPEWLAHDPVTREMFLTLTNNDRRGVGTNAPINSANPRTRNVFGHVIRWREQGDDPTALRFAWSILALCGDGVSADPAVKGNINGDIYASPDGLWMDNRRVLWIQTDMSDSVMRAGEYTPFGNNMMVGCDPDNGLTKRFLTGPTGCEVTGMVQTPNGRAFFVNIQHPGDIPRDLFAAGARMTPQTPMAASRWPDGAAAGRPRSSTVVITKDDGGIVGT